MKEACKIITKLDSGNKTIVKKNRVVNEMTDGGENPL